MAFVAYRGKVEERYQGNPLIEHDFRDKRKIGTGKRPCRRERFSVSTYRRPLLQRIILPWRTIAPWCLSQPVPAKANLPGGWS
jgi:hypothetical protein